MDDVHDLRIPMHDEETFKHGVTFEVKVKPMHICILVVSSNLYSINVMYVFTLFWFHSHKIGTCGFICLSFFIYLISILAAWTLCDPITGWTFWQL